MRVRLHTLHVGVWLHVFPVVPEMFDHSPHQGSTRHSWVGDVAQLFASCSSACASEHSMLALCLQRDRQRDGPYLLLLAASASLQYASTANMTAIDATPVTRLPACPLICPCRRQARCLSTKLCVTCLLAPPFPYAACMSVHAAGGLAWKQLLHDFWTPLECAVMAAKSNSTSKVQSHIYYSGLEAGLLNIVKQGVCYI